jgi:hypothetical protein
MSASVHAEHTPRTYTGRVKVDFHFPEESVDQSSTCNVPERLQPATLPKIWVYLEGVFCCYRKRILFGRETI